MPLSSSRPRADAGTARGELRALLARYPQLSGCELDRLASIGKARLLDVGLLSSRPDLGDKYHGFRGGEARRLGPTAWETARFHAFYLVPGARITWAVAQVA